MLRFDQFLEMTQGQDIGFVLPPDSYGRYGVDEMIPFGTPPPNESRVRKVGVRFTRSLTIKRINHCDIYFPYGKEFGRNGKEALELAMQAIAMNRGRYSEVVVIDWWRGKGLFEDNPRTTFEPVGYERTKY